MDFPYLSGQDNSYLSGLSAGYGGNGNALQELMNALGASGGAFGLGAGPTGALFTAGSSLLSGIGDLIGGPSKSEKGANEIYNLAKNRLGQSVIDPDQYLSEYMRASRDRINAYGERLNRKFGLDSGTAQSDLFANMEGGIAQFMLGAKQQADVLKSQNDNALLALMANVNSMRG